MPSAPPEAVIIEAKRKALRPILSVRRIAPLAGLSEARWRQIAKGSQTMSGVTAPVRAPAETIMRMLAVVGELTERELQTLSQARPDVAALYALYQANTREDEPAAAAGVAPLADLLRAIRTMADQALRMLGNGHNGGDTDQQHSAQHTTLGPGESGRGRTTGERAQRVTTTEVASLLAEHGWKLGTTPGDQSVPHSKNEQSG